jgi:hypothetical protein
VWLIELRKKLYQHLPIYYEEYYPKNPKQTDEQPDGKDA